MKFCRHYFKMETIFMNKENNETNEPHSFKLDLANKRNLKNPNKNIKIWPQLIQVFTTVGKI